MNLQLYIVGNSDITCVGIVGAIHSKVAIYLPTYPTTVNMLVEYNSINSMYMPRSETLFYC